MSHTEETQTIEIRACVSCDPPCGTIEIRLARPVIREVSGELVATIRIPNRGIIGLVAALAMHLAQLDPNTTVEDDHE